MAISKVVYGNQVLLDLTADSVEPSKLASGITAHDKTGAAIVGTNTYDSDTKDATANAAEILATKTAYVNGVKVEGTMPNRGGVTDVITNVDDEITIQSGYHDGSGKVTVDSTEKAKIIAGNIKDGVEILGVTGTYTGDLNNGQTKTVTPYTNKPLTVLPDAGYDYLAQVNVEKIAYVETENAAGGITATIGTVSAD